MKKKRLIICIVAVVAVLLAMALLAVGIKKYHMTPGFHCFCDYVNVDFKENCWYFDSKTRELLGSGTLTLKGRGKADKLLDGELCVPEYMNPETYVDPENEPDNPYFRQETLVITKQDDFWNILGTQLYERNAGSGGDEYQSFPCNFQYKAYVNPDDTGFMAVWISGRDGLSVFAVCEDSESVARIKLEALPDR